MRVTHIITRLIVGGAQENTVSSVLGLQRKPGLEIDLISGPTTGPEGSLESAFAHQPNSLRLARHLIRAVHPLHDWLALRELTQMLRVRRPDIVHTHSSKAGILGRLAAQRAGVPIIIHTIHGPSFGAFQGPLANLIFTTAERHAARCTTHFVTVANAMTQQFLKAGIGHPDQFTRVFSGFPLEPFLSATNDASLRSRYGLKPGDFVVGKIARLFKLKGHDDLMDAAPGIIRRCPQIKFLLVGGGPWRPAKAFHARCPRRSPPPDPSLPTIAMDLAKSASTTKRASSSHPATRHASPNPSSRSPRNQSSENDSVATDNPSSRNASPSNAWWTNSMPST